jgi:aminoglycoside phosphotransferase family enzyme
MAAARERVRCLREHFADSTGQPVRLIETHISWVLLGDAIAWKLKKPVRLGFLDFRTLAARRHACDEELRVNRRLAPEIYLDVVEIVETPAGPRPATAGHPVDVAVRMRRFPDGTLWSERLASGDLRPDDVDVLAALLGRFHVSAPAGTTLRTRTRGARAFGRDHHPPDIHSHRTNDPWSFRP